MEVRSVHGSSAGTRSPGRSRTPLALALLVVLVATACGTRLSDAEREAARARGAGQGQAAAPGGPVADQSGGARPADGARASTGPAEDGSGPPEEVAEGGERSGAEGSGSSGPASGPSGDPGDGDDAPGDDPGGGGDGGSEGASGDPLVLGLVSTLSGPGGSSNKPNADMIKLWVRDVNARGGVDGHPIELETADDALDQSRHFSEVRRLVEEEGAFAFIGNSNRTATGEATRGYLEERGIPVISGMAFSQPWQTSPVLFAPGVTGADFVRGSVAGAAELRPELQDWGQITCRESESCSLFGEHWPRFAREQGLDVVYQAEASVGSPDYTSECLSAQNAGVEMLGVVLDPNGVRRLAQSCARQGYTPQLVAPSAVLSSNHSGDENLEGTLGFVQSAPWSATEVPGVRAMHDAVEELAPDMRLDVASTMGWGAGRLFESAVSAAGGLGSPPSRERLLDGLYASRDETANGVFAPLSFERGKEKRVDCLFSIRFEDGAWTPVNGGEPICP